MGVRPSRHAKYDHVPLLTEMEQLHGEDHDDGHDHYKDYPHPHQQQQQHQDLPHHYFFSSPFPPLTSAPLAPTAAAPATTLDPHHANFTFYRSSIPPRHARSRKLSKLRRILLCGGGDEERKRGGGGGRKSKRGMMMMMPMTVKGRGYRDDDEEDNLSVAESYTSSLKSSASSISIVSALNDSPPLPPPPHPAVSAGVGGKVLGAVRMCELKERRGLGDE